MIEMVEQGISQITIADDRRRKLLVVARCEHAENWLCWDCYAEAVQSAKTAGREEIIREISPYLEYMRDPLEAARRELRPSLEPLNADVGWHTGGDTVIELLELMDKYKRALGDKE